MTRYWLAAFLGYVLGVAGTLLVLWWREHGPMCFWCDRPALHGSDACPRPDRRQR